MLSLFTHLSFINDFQSWE